MGWYIVESLRSFSPEHLFEDAQESGFFQCPKCGLIWFGRADILECPSGPHGQPVHVAVLCRICDAVVRIEDFVAHLAGREHDLVRKIN
jgi:hypothetical protein